MEALPPGTSLTADELRQLLARKAGNAVLNQSLHRSLRASRSGGGATAVTVSLTIAVCTRNRPVWLGRMLDSVDSLLAGVADDVKVDVLVVDNASSDGRTREVAAAHNARYVLEPRAGLDFARNRAGQEATGDWLVFFDDDVVVDPGWLPAFTAMLTDNPDAAAMTGSVVPLTLETPAQVLFERRGGFRTTFLRARFQGTPPTDLTYPAGGGAFGTGANMAVRTDVLAAIGGFDEALDTGAPLPGGGDLDLFQRVVRAGHVLVFDPGCLVWHEHRRDLGGLRRQLGRSWGTGYLAAWSKAYHADPALRPRLRLHLWTWWRDMTRRLAGNLLRPQHRSMAPFTFAEIWGAVVGLAGGYRRSQRRVEKIRRSIP
jgi:GT2 family glycosyltransferase